MSGPSNASSQSEASDLDKAIKLSLATKPVARPSVDKKSKPKPKRNQSGPPVEAEVRPEKKQKNQSAPPPGLPVIEDVMNVSFRKIWSYRGIATLQKDDGPTCTAHFDFEGQRCHLTFDWRRASITGQYHEVNKDLENIFFRPEILVEVAYVLSKKGVVHRRLDTINIDGEIMDWSRVPAGACFAITIWSRRDDSSKKKQKQEQQPAAPRHSCLGELLWRPYMAQDASCDFTLLVGGRQKIDRVHATVLAVRSEFFARLVSSDYKEAKDRTALLPQVEPEQWTVLARWCYCGKYNSTDWTWDVMADLYGAAHLLKLHDFLADVAFVMAEKIQLGDILKVQPFIDRYGDSDAAPVARMAPSLIKRCQDLIRDDPAGMLGLVQKKSRPVSSSSSSSSSDAAKPPNATAALPLDADDIA